MIPLGMSDDELFNIVNDNVEYNNTTGTLTRRKSGMDISTRNSIVMFIYEGGKFWLQPKEIAWLLYYGKPSKCQINQKNNVFYDITIENLIEGKPKCEKYITYLPRNKRFRLSLGNLIFGIPDYYFGNMDAAKAVKAYIRELFTDWKKYVDWTDKDGVYVMDVNENILFADKLLNIKFKITTNTLSKMQDNANNVQKKMGV